MTIKVMPDYVVVVMRKCGTTWTYGLYLRDNGEYELSDVLPGTVRGPEPKALARALEKRWKLGGRSGQRRKVNHPDNPPPVPLIPHARRRKPKS